MQGRAAWEAQLLSDMLMFAGCCICRLVVGQHSYALFAELGDLQRRVLCERVALRIGRRLLAGHGSFGSIRAVTDMVVRESAAELLSTCNQSL